MAGKRTDVELKTEVSRLTSLRTALDELLLMQGWEELEGKARLAPLLKSLRECAKRLDRSLANLRSLQDSEDGFRYFFEESPVALWEEDFTDIKRYIDRQRRLGVEDFRKHLDEHPEVVADCARMVKVVEVSKATLDLYKASSQEAFKEGLATIFSEESYEVFKEELVAIAEGKTSFESEAVTHSLTGDRIHTSLRWSVPPGYEDSFSRVFVSVMEIGERKRTEERLRDSEERYRSIYNHAPVMIHSIDADGCVLSVNDHWLEVLGYAREEVIGRKRVVDFMTEASRRYAVETAIPKLKQTGSVREIELQMVKKNGAVIDILLSSIAERDKRGRFASGVAFAVDVTERKRAEEELRRSGEELEDRIKERTAQLSTANKVLRDEIAERERAQAALQETEARFRTLVEHAPEAIVLLDADTGKFVDANENATRLFGLEREVLLNVGPSDISPPIAPDGRPSAEFASEKIQEALNGGTPVYERIHRNAAGKDIPCEVRLVRMPAANRNLVRGSVIDITGRKEVEESLRRYAKRLETLQEIDRAILGARSPAAIAEAVVHHIREVIPCVRASVTVLDPDTGEAVVQAVHGKGEARLGKGQRVPLERIEEAWGSADELRRGKVCGVDDIAAADLPPTPVVEALKAEGIRSWINVPLLSQGDLIGTLNVASERPRAFIGEYVEIAREVADSLAIAIQQTRLLEQVKRHAAQLEQRVRERTAELESFSYSVSHDLRTPLRAIDSFSGVFLTEYSHVLDAEGRRLMDIVRTNAKMMDQLIEGLLTLSHLGRQELSFTAINMAELAERVFGDLRSLVPHRKLALLCQPMPPARGDAALIRQVFVNLTSNAIKFTEPRGNAIIEVGSKVEDENVVYYVKDNGVGFDMSYADKLFGVFQRLHGTDEYEGSGVGLAIVDRIIQRHGGRIWADSRLNEGATFYFTLPS